VEVVEDETYSSPERRFYRFDTLTRCPIDARLVEPSMLTDAERAWLDGYHQLVHRTLAPLLPRPERAWLKRMCARL